jgi:hypothetical protein
MANEGILTVRNGLSPHPAGNAALRGAIEAVSRRVHLPVASTGALAALTDAYDGMFCLVGTAAKVPYHYVAAAESGDVESTGMGAGYWNIVNDTDTAALALLASTANGEGASLVAIEDSGELYAAAQSEAAFAEVMTKLNSAVAMYHREFDHADSDVAVDATSVDIDFGAALPTNAIVAAVLANVTEAWDDDGPTDTWEADVGVSSGDADKYTPTPLTLDTQADLGTQVSFLDASATQLALQIRASGSKKLNELVAGKLDLTVLFVTPELTEVAAPS